jgi:hypothetical protein
MVAALEPGRDAFVVPWAMHVDPDGRCLVAAAASWTDTASGTSQMRIRRLPDGVAVDLTGVTHRWTPSGTPSCGVGVDTTELLPVCHWM